MNEYATQPNEDQEPSYGYFEPWRITSDGNIVDAWSNGDDQDEDDDGDLILDCDRLYPDSMTQGQFLGRTRDRIVDYVNFCAGVSSDKLPPNGLAELLTERGQLQAENVQLCKQVDTNVCIFAR